jgi:hypothetical protein
MPFTIGMRFVGRVSCLPSRPCDPASDLERSITTPGPGISQLVFLALFGFLVVLAQHLAVRVDLDAPLLAIFLDDGFEVGALFFPAQDFPAFSFVLARSLHRARNIAAIYCLLLVLALFCLRGHA